MNSTEIRNSINAIKSAAHCMNFPDWQPNAGQQAMIDRLEAQLAEMEG